MLELPVEQDIRTRTLKNIQKRFQIDADQGKRVRQLADHFFQQVATAWQLDIRCRELLSSASLIHEIGLSVDFRKGPEHAGYLVSNLDLPVSHRHNAAC